MEQALYGYVGVAKKLLEKSGAKLGDEVEVESEGRKYRGILISRYETAKPDYIVIKLRSGYNIGVKVGERSTLIKLAEGKQPAFTHPPKPLTRRGLPRVKVVSTGGTICSRVDYRTGAVKPALTAEDLFGMVPELAEVAEVESEVLYSIYSENIKPNNWTEMATKVNDLIKSGYDGIVLPHGTDTLGYTAAALSFALRKPPVPVVLVGAQRSSDRPSSDASRNLLASVRVAAKAPFAEVCVVMHAWHSDELMAVHRGTRVVKLHTSSRDAFKSVNAEPIAYISNGSIKVNSQGLNPRGSEDYEFNPRFDPNAFLVKFFPGMNPDILDFLVSKGAKGIVIEGTGLGHVASDWIPTIRKLARDGIFLGMTSQCKYGRVNMQVYDNGRDLLRAGITPLDDMLAETALVKLMWALANFYDGSNISKVKEIMLTNMAGEIGSRSIPR